MEEEEKLMRLRAFGLTKYEAEIYFLLLKYGMLSAMELGDKSKVPITRVYDTAHSLTEKGLIGIVNLRPKQYGVLPFKTAFKTLIFNKKAEFKRQIYSLVKEHGALVREFSGMLDRPAPQAEEFMFTMRGRKAILSAWHSMFLSTKKELFIFSGDSSWLESEMHRVKRLIGKNVDVRVLANSKNLVALRKAALSGLNIRISDTSMRGIVSDRKRLYLSKKFTTATKDEEYSCVLTEDRGIVSSSREYFLMKWAAAKPVLP